MPLGDLQRREHSLLSLLLVTSLLLSTQYLWHLAGRGGRSAVRTVKTVIREIWDWHEWLDDLATSLENDAGHHTGEEEEGSRMVIGLQDSQGKIVNGTEEQEYFASSVKPRRKRPAEASSITLQGKFSHPSTSDFVPGGRDRLPPRLRGEGRGAGVGQGGEGSSLLAQTGRTRLGVSLYISFTRLKKPEKK